ncbi:MAG TPA: TIGR04551 family protein, partial [Polyangiaceae bacterium]|nr:TIGR04551 family protein [Polyangiaceae bacterium]
MHRFSPVLGPLTVLLLSLPVLAQAQTAQGGAGGNAPSAPGEPPATTTPATPDAPPAPTSPPATPPPSSSPPSSSAAGGAAPIDRSSLLAPAPAGRAAAPAEPRDTERKVDTSIGANPKAVYAEDWWVHSRPVFELHGVLRVRAELLHNFSLGRVDRHELALWPQPVDNSYSTSGGQVLVKACGDNGQNFCEDKSQAGANMRFRVNPELHVSDNLRVMSQIDMLDNLVLGSTPAGYNGQSQTQSPSRAPTSPYTPIGAFATTQVPPTSGLNSFQNSINIRRAWGEYATPVGQLRFGRMPNHWGLGILENSGDTYDSDWQSTVDRIMFTT